MLEDIFKLGLMVSFIDEITKPLKKTEKSLSGFEKKVSRLNEKFKKFTTYGAKMASVGFGVASAIAAPTTAAVEFSKGMAEVLTLVNTSAVNMAHLRNRLLQIAPAIGMDTSTATKALYNIISAGVKAGDALSVLKLAGKAAVAGVTDVNTAATIGTQIMNAYSMSVKDLPHIYDLLFTTVKNGVTTFPELSQYLGDVLASASAAKVPLEQVMAAIAGMTKAGIKTPEATTALKGLLVALAAPSSLAAKKLHELGGEEFNSAIASGNLVKALSMLSTKVHSLADVRAIIPEESAAKAFLSLSQHLNDFKAGVDGMKHSSGAMETAFKKMAATSAFAWSQTKSALHSVAITIGMALLPAVRSLAVGFYKALVPLQKFILNHQKLAKAILLPLGLFSLIAIALGSLLTVFGFAGMLTTRMIMGYKNLSKALELLKTRYITIMTPIKEFIAAQFASLKASVAAEGGILGFARAIWTGFIGSIRAAIGALRTFAVSALSSPIGWIGLTLALAAMLIYKYWQPLRAFFRGVFQGIAEAIKPLKPAFKVILEPLKFIWVIIKKVASAVVSLLKPVHETKNQLNGLTETGRTVGKVLLYAFLPVLIPIRALMYLVGQLKNIGGSLGYAFKSAAGGIVSAVRWIIGEFLKVKSVWDVLKNAFSKGLHIALTPIRLFIEEIKKLFHFMSHFSLHEAGKKIVKTLYTGIGSVAMMPVHAVKSIVQKIRNLLPFSPAKEGPLSDLNKIKLTQTIADTIKPQPLIDKFKSILSQIGNMATKTSLFGKVKWLFDKIKLPALPDIAGRVKWLTDEIKLPSIPSLFGKVKWIGDMIHPTAKEQTRVATYSPKPIQISLTQHININGNADKETVKQIGITTQEAIRQAIERYFYEKARVAW